MPNRYRKDFSGLLKLSLNSCLFICEILADARMKSADADEIHCVDEIKSVLLSRRKADFTILMKFAALRQVKQRRCRCEVLCFAQSEVKCATHARRHFTAKQLHDAKRHFMCRKAHFVEKSTLTGSLTD